MFKNWKANNARRVDFLPAKLLEIPKSKWGYLRNTFVGSETTQDGEPTPDNPVPIVGTHYDDDITVCGENLIDITASKWSGNSRLKGIAGNSITIEQDTTGGTWRSYNLPIHGGELLAGKQATVYAEWEVSASNSGAVRLMWANRNGSLSGDYIIGYNSGIAVTGVIPSKPTQAGDWSLCLMLYSSVNSPATAGDTVTYTKVQVNLGSTATAYTPYIGTTTPYTVEGLDGTKYTRYKLPDGTEDEVGVDNNLLLKNTNIKKLNGSENGWQLYIEDVMSDYIRFINDIAIVDRILANNDLNGTSGRFLCTHFAPGRAWSDYDAFFDCFSFSNATQRIFMKINKSELTGYAQELDEWQKVSLFRAWLSENPIDILYCCEPQTIPLKPLPKIQTIEADKAYIFNSNGTEISTNAISYGGQ